MTYQLPTITQPDPVPEHTALLIASGDLRPAANQTCWPAQKAMEQQAAHAFQALGWTLKRAHSFGEAKGHGFIDSQRHGMDVFAAIDPDAPLVVAEAVWQYSHHVLAGLCKHKGPILTLANWSGTWPGLVGVLNLNGSLTKAGVNYSCLWGEDFSDEGFLAKLKQWTDTGSIEHDQSHVQPFSSASCPDAERQLAGALAAQLRSRRAIMGVFDEGCMGMFNAIIPDHLLHPTGVFKERLSQSALFAEMQATPDSEAQTVRHWLDDAGMTFATGTNEETDLTDSQILLQCKMYIAALRIADDFGCDAVGIQYQQGLKDCCPASDLAEGLLNNAERPPVTSRDGTRLLYEGRPLPHFNEVDECAGLDALLTNRVWASMGQPPETTLHDLRWGDWDQSGTTDDYVWVWLISGSAPPAHFIDGYRGASSERQPPMYFRLGGGTLKGVSHPGEVVWSRVYVEDDTLQMDIGRNKVIELPAAETRRRWEATTSQWPIMHAVTYGVTRDQMMAKHKANHLNVAYASDAQSADRAVAAKAALASELGITVNLCGTNHAGVPLADAIAQLT
ncbi:MAG: fucose isomerase [Planctomycetes bacterium]|nr:fucose isomerase [Planctomycetota bacterium]NOG53879.1 fucose isomerase [Planctomycetota bacterium]